MFTYLLKRLFAMIPTLLGITFVTFLIIDLAPGDPINTSLGAGAGGRSTEGGGNNPGDTTNSEQTKKKLLGMIVEDYAVHAWETTVGAVPEAEQDEFQPVYAPVVDRGGIGELSVWPRSIAVPATGDRVFVGTQDGEVRVAQVGSDDEPKLLARFEGEIWSLAVTDGIVAVGTSDGEVRFLSDSGEALGGTDTLEFPVDDVVFVPGGKQLLSACDDGVVRLHSVPSGAVERELRDHTGYVRAVAVSPDGTRCWSGGYDSDLREWDLASGERTRVIGTHGQAIRDIVVSADGAFLVTASDDRKLRRFDLASAEAAGEAGTTFEGHYKGVTAAALSKDGSTLFSGSTDKTIRAWDVATGKQFAQTPEDAGGIFGLVVTSDGRSLLSCGESWRKVPIWTRYLNWMGRVARLDFDRSIKDDQLVIDKMKKALPVTLYLNLISIFLMYLISIPLGVMAAVKRGTLFDNVTSVALFLLWSVPNFWLATLLIMGFSSKRTLDVLPSVGTHSDTADQLTYLPWLADWGLHLILPIITLTYAGFASLSRYMRTSMLETISHDFIRTARAKGLSERVVVFKHALRNSLITIITLIGNLLPAMIGGSVIVEFIFSINGMGRLAFDAILARDYPVIMAVTTFSALLTLVGILVSDLLYGAADPRISHG